jgi:hypothetical protein
MRFTKLIKRALPFDDEMAAYAIARQLGKASVVYLGSEKVWLVWNYGLDRWLADDALMPEK